MLIVNLGIRKGTGNERTEDYEDGLALPRLLACLERWEKGVGAKRQSKFRQQQITLFMV